MAETKVLRLEWDGPFLLDAVLGMTGGDDYGLYQIYSHHVIFGPSSLVYVGKAQERTFGTRFAEHRDYWLQWESDVCIRLGRLAPADYRTDDNWDEWKQLVSALLNG